MDIEKVNALARSLKEKHLAANMEDAMKQAKQILGYKGGEDSKEDLKTVDELFAEEKKSVDNAEHLKDELDDLKEDIEETEKEDKKEEKEIEEIKEEVEESQDGIEEIKSQE